MQAGRAMLAAGAILGTLAVGGAALTSCYPGGSVAPSPVVVANNLLPTFPYGANPGGSSFVETMPFGNPPADHDDAARFAVTNATPVRLSKLVLFLYRSNGLTPMDVWLVGDAPPNGTGLTSTPDMSSPLEHWSVDSIPGIPNTQANYLQLDSQSSPLLQPGAQYWIVASFSHVSGNRVGWWSGNDQSASVAGAAVAERYYGCSGCTLPDGTWNGGDTSIGFGMKITGVPTS